MEGNYNLYEGGYRKKLRIMNYFNITWEFPYITTDRSTVDVPPGFSENLGPGAFFPRLTIRLA